MHRLLCLTVLIGCASATPGSPDLRDGAPVRPAPVFVTPGYTPAGAGLPEYMPGPPEPVRVEPNPRPARVLPETPHTRREAGLWASSTPSSWPQVLEVPLPGPENPSDTETVPASLCSYFINKRIDEFGLRRALENLSPAERKCFVGRAYHDCASRHEGEVARDEKRSAALKAAFVHAVIFAEDLKTRACAKGATPEVERLSLVFEGM